ncbi:hypothetical protein HYH02_001223 [Chlamydomonas schloesseri]|uniref:Endonuclease/exonuclease/phosphatase domain-containing protein n=1 Tax=Chlamydomonas schloesseri TaxID=2026947 RepID=A0A835WVZ1_9CHLO|nr:hypothetical protein HYH02_001223 [Chlamydomonas schloesseri]|eukprot:KAG2454188.1 hypothetical protein HYH02_001223 [Chlamydomonas schloesseri]
MKRAALSNETPEARQSISTPRQETPRTQPHTPGPFLEGRRPLPAGQAGRAEPPAAKRALDGQLAAAADGQQGGPGADIARPDELTKEVVGVRRAADDEEQGPPLPPQAGGAGKAEKEDVVAVQQLQLPPVFVAADAGPAGRAAAVDGAPGGAHAAVPAAVGQAGQPAAAGGDEVMVHLPINIVTYNVHSVKPAAGGAAVATAQQQEVDLTAVEQVLGALMGSMGCWRLSEDLQSRCQLDVICLQEVKIDQNQTGRLAGMLDRMRDKGYDHVRAGEQVVLWNRRTMARVAGDAGGGEPDYVWTRKRGSVPYLEAAWGGVGLDDAPPHSQAYGTALEDMKPYAARQRQERVGGQATSSRLADYDTFFRYPPITVVLQRRAESTGSSAIYVITTAHTPGGATDPKDLVQLAREVGWLMDGDVAAGSYKAVMRHMLSIKKPGTEALRAAVAAAIGENEDLLSVAPHRNVVHLVVGDFNKDLYDKSSAAQDPGGGGGGGGNGGNGNSNRALRSQAPFSCLHAWTAFQGSSRALSEPTTALNHPDVAYVHTCSAKKAGLTHVGSFTLPLKRLPTKKGKEDKGLFYGSDHKPVMFSFREQDQSPVPLMSLERALQAELEARVAARVEAELEARVAARVEAELEARVAASVAARVAVRTTKIKAALSRYYDMLLNISWMLLQQEPKKGQKHGRMEPAAVQEIKGHVDDLGQEIQVLLDDWNVQLA